MFGKPKHPFTWQDLAAARRVQEVAINQLQTAQQAVTVLQEVWIQELRARNTKEAEKAKQELAVAKQELADVETKLGKAKQEVEKAKGAAKASVQAGRGQAGGLLRVQLLLLRLGLQHSRVRFRAGPPFLLFGVMLSSQQGSPRR